MKYFIQTQWVRRLCQRLYKEKQIMESPTSSKSKTDLRTSYEQVPAIIWTTDQKFRLTSIEGREVQRLNLKKTKALGQPLFEYLDIPESKGKTLKAHEKALNGDSVGIDFAWSGKAYQACIHPILNSEGLVQGIIGVAVDVTQQKRLDEQSQGARRMEVIGQIAGGMAHDFNNVLAVIQNYSHLIMEETRENKETYEDIQVIQGAAERGARLVKQLLAFGRRQIIQPKLLRLNPVIEEISGSLRRLMPENVEFFMNLEKEIGNIMADPRQIEEILMSLVIHACEGMADGGQLTIETKNQQITNDYAKQFRGMVPGSYVAMFIKDTAEGMDEKAQSKIFEPFFTTRELGMGSGFGLAAVYGIVKQNNGYISVESAPGKGTVFSIYLPRVEGPTHQTEPTTSYISKSSRGQTILLVEDDDELRRGLFRILREQGYLVLEARDAEDALRLYQEQKESVDLLLTDLILPKMSGRKLSEELKKSWPSLRVLYMTGYSNETIARYGVNKSETLLILKPFSPSLLFQKIREALS